MGSACPHGFRLVHALPFVRPTADPQTSSGIGPTPEAETSGFTATTGWAHHNPVLCHSLLCSCDRTGARLVVSGAVRLDMSLRGHVGRLDRRAVENKQAQGTGTLEARGGQEPRVPRAQSQLLELQSHRRQLQSLLWWGAGRQQLGLTLTLPAFRRDDLRLLV